MKRYITRILRIASLALGFASSQVLSQTFPAKPIHVILPFAVGGLLDATVRAIGQQVSESIGQAVIVENRPGGSTFIGMSACAKAPPDGYTVCITTPDSLSYNQFLFTKLSYDPEKDFAPVTNLVLTDNIVVAHASAPFGTFKEMIAYAKANPGKVNWGTWGVGSIPHIYLEAINRGLGVEIVAVPYKGAGQAFPAILAGEVHATYGGLGFALPHIKAGRLKALATTPERSPLLPDVPTMKELGAEPGLPSYFGVFAPAATPPAVLEKLAAEFAKALRTPKIQDFLAAQTLRPVGNSPAEFAEFVKADRANAQRVFQSMGIRPTDAP
jgi:tripartite-type tricarboxylate transporter receptor subunit TctC